MKEGSFIIAASVRDYTVEDGVDTLYYGSSGWDSSLDYAHGYCSEEAALEVLKNNYASDVSNYIIFQVVKSLK